MTKNKQNLETPGPKGKLLSGNLGAIQKDPLNFFLEASRNFGNVVKFRIGLRPVYLVNHPDHLKRVFQENRDNYIRSKYYRELLPILGSGLFTLEGEEWRRQRATSQPAVRGPNLIKMVGEMTEATDRFIERLIKSEAKGSPVEVTSEASSLTLDIVMRALFSTALMPKDFQAIFISLSAILSEVERRIWQPFPAPLLLATKRNRDLKTNIQNLDEVIYSVIQRRIEAGPGPNDLLDLILEAEKGKEGPETRRSIRDQIISVILAGHETGANALSWLFYELSRRPEIVRTIRAEAEKVFDGGKPTFESYKQLHYTTRVFQEILRLYPPAWTMSRVAVKADKLGKHLIPKGATVMLCPFTIHRHPDFWQNPDRFDPDRFLPAAASKRHPTAYFPFGGGPHFCLGNRFALLEGVLTLAAICLVFDFELCPGQRLKPSPMTTLRPNKPVLVKLKRVAKGIPLAA